MTKKIIASLLIVGNTFMYRLLPKDAKGNGKGEVERGALSPESLRGVIIYYISGLLYL